MVIISYVNKGTEVTAIRQGIRKIGKICAKIMSWPGGWRK
ncbi:hypothetical protein [Caldibacillus phage CBP1]|nr:hypothetical protein [Caldibacillus phage CBP1]